MKLSNRLIALVLTMVTLPLVVAVSRTMSAQAAPAGQIEDPITQTLKDANQSLGGDFVLDPDNSMMTRTRQGAYANGDPVDITDYMSITSETPNTYCNSYPGEFWNSSTFHGRDGCSLTYGDHPANLIWEVPFGSQARGDDVVFDVGSIVDGCYCYVQHPDADPKVSTDSINVTPLAEALNQAAIKNGVYEPMPGEDPAVQSDVHPGTSDNGASPGVPLPIALGNLAVPLAGGVAGTLLAVGLSTLSSASSASAGTASVVAATRPNIGDANDQGMVWSERPWDVAGDGYVTRAEYERTRSLRSQGYEWTQDGWQTPAERGQSQQWDENNKAALRREDANWKAQQADQRKQVEMAQQDERKRLVESYLPPEPPASVPAPTAQEGPWGIDPSAEASAGGDLNNGKIDPNRIEANVGTSVTVYKNAYYDMPDKKGDITVFGWDLGNYKADVQIGKVQTSGGGSINPEKPENRQFGIGESASAIESANEMVLGNKYLGITLDATLNGPNQVAFVGYKDGGVGGSLGISAGSVDTGIGVNLGGVNATGRVGLNAGMEWSLKLGANGEVKVGPFKLGYSLGWAKTGT